MVTLRFSCQPQFQWRVRWVLVAPDPGVLAAVGATPGEGARHALAWLYSDNLFFLRHRFLQPWVSATYAAVVPYVIGSRWHALQDNTNACTNALDLHHGCLGGTHPLRVVMIQR